MKLMLKYLKRYPKLILLNIIGIFSFVAVQLGIPTVMAWMIDNGIGNGDIAYIKKMGVIMLFVCILGGAGTILLTFASSRISTYMIRDIRNDVFTQSQKFSHTEYNKFGVSSMITRTTNDAFQLMLFSNLLFRTALLAPVMIFISVFMTIRTSINLSLVIGGSLPFIVVGTIIIAKLTNPLSEKQQKGMDQLNLISRENLTGVRVIRAFRKSEYEAERFAETNDNYATNSKNLYKIMSFTQPAFFFLLHLAMMAVFWISSVMIDKGTLQVGQLVAFLEYQFHAMFSIMLFSMVFVMYPRAQVSANRIQELLDEEPSVKDPTEGITAENKGMVEFDHVTFQYPDGELPVLKDVSFTANKGETVAFIGSTGSGKSTLINLIPRFYDVTEGSIKIDGVDTRSYDLKVLRQKIGFIPQKAFLFKGTIEENLKFGNPNATPEEIDHAIEVAQAKEFIQNKPNKLQEYISEGAKNVSGGQKQRISIARALVRKPEIYIFDDSFSALDFKTDATLRAALKEETKESVVFIVAQRISTIMNADKIIVLNEGEVVGMGTHKELLKSCNIYYEIADSQLTKEELER
ncbi:ATP-binding cassette, subfamily B, multidrug efflux pump [Anaerosporobacter mobilis DSM 15930]|jgi:ATP-binding cassette subfamily B multidrug efflux pump|uniref:ATP-binding cassette, subfamily B, multidrug efflux pump n=1 Tax=Anaerosporobacter mobilis DSM 15930 TaxID=1120996 RepID=A0A1M7FUH6_9FIRM|nr:ABC transporter ATP-binding protein [Anaerosporobacter mobilis]SHM07337.1 ATP-binding cassette, subfamily B, multidrug efflux pump [Anaerosporobacter mobilis DSM 15930]